MIFNLQLSKYQNTVKEKWVSKANENLNAPCDNALRFVLIKNTDLCTLKSKKQK